MAQRLVGRHGTATRWQKSVPTAPTTVGTTVLLRSSSLDTVQQHSVGKVVALGVVYLLGVAGGLVIYQTSAAPEVCVCACVRV